MRKSIALFVLSLAALLSGCGSSHRAPVTDTEGGPRFLNDGRMHRVNDGETLYSIAWMYDLNYLDLAAHNNIGPPYTIFHDQFLRVDVRPGAPRPPVATVASAPVQRPAQAVTVNPVTITRSSDTRTAAPLPESPTASAARPAPPPAAAPSRQPLPAPVVNRQPTVSPPPAPAPAPRAAPAAPLPSGPIVWAWPASGSIVGRFSANGVDNKGIDIGGSRGQEVLAAADGEVVFAGSGLLRYGEMIILKHNDQFLSAYAHNSRLLVSEGERVRRGQKIAELGSTGINRDMLHFEIRQAGKPVDPMNFLPPR